MARPKSDDKRIAIFEATIRVIAVRGLGAATALIAKEAGISTGSLFTYFPTKSDLLNALYVELKEEMASAALDDLPAGESTRAQLSHMWDGWLRWATRDPGRRQTLAQLSVSGEINAASREAGHVAMADIARLLERSRSEGPLREAPIGLVAGLMNAVADATVDFSIADPDNAQAHRSTGFEALWRMLA